MSDDYYTAKKVWVPCGWAAHTKHEQKYTQCCKGTIIMHSYSINNYY